VDEPPALWKLLRILLSIPMVLAITTKQFAEKPITPNATISVPTTNLPLRPGMRY